MGGRRQGRELVGLLRLAPGRLVAALVTVEAATAVLPLGVVWTVGWLVGRVVGGGAVGAPLASLVALLLLQQLLGPLKGAVSYRIVRRIDGVMRARAMAAANRSPGVGPLEDPDVLDLLFLAGGDIDAYWEATPGTAAVAYAAVSARYVQAAGAALLLARAAPVVAAALVLTVAIVRRRYRKVRYQWGLARRAIFVPGRAARYTAALANAPAGAKETRLFGLLDWLLARHKTQWNDLVETFWRTRRRLVQKLMAVVAVLAPIAAVLFVTLARADLSPREMAVALQSALLVAGLFEVKLEEFQVDFGLESFHALLDAEQRLRPPPTRAPPRPAAGLPTRDIRFEGVDFAYPGSGRKVFDGLDLTIPAGSSLAIVGVNGAGKTTLVKLLARLYEPDAGRVTADGVDVADLDPDEWRERLAVIFQDFVHYDLAAADNVGFGGLRLAVTADRAAALAAAAAKAGASEVIARLPAGWETPLSRQYRGGADLSGGQWQRLALARALFAVDAGAGVLVLDEPTANLDVRAEAELFDRFLDLTAGLTTVLISHRFSTVRRAERIVVLQGGRVTEQGTHDELLAAGGAYATMFSLQASRFDD